MALPGLGGEATAGLLGRWVVVAGSGHLAFLGNSAPRSLAPRRGHLRSSAVTRSRRWAMPLPLLVGAAMRMAARAVRVTRRRMADQRGCRLAQIASMLLLYDAGPSCYLLQLRERHGNTPVLAHLSTCDSTRALRVHIARSRATHDHSQRTRKLQMYMSAMVRCCSTLFTMCAETKWRTRCGWTDWTSRLGRCRCGVIYSLGLVLLLLTTPQPWQSRCQSSDTVAVHVRS